jgi:hypothetical protein
LYGGSRTIAHNAIVSELSRLSSVALLHPKMEVRPFDDARRVDLTIKCGSTVHAFDVAITHPLLPGNVLAAAEAPGGAATQYERVKVKKYSADCTKLGFVFAPLVVDTFGAWGSGAFPFLTLLGAEYAKRLDASKPRGRVLVAARLSVVIQRAIARLLLGSNTFDAAPINVAPAASTR